MSRWDFDPTAISAVLLDMDGTLVDSDAADERAWMTWSREQGIDVATTLKAARGNPIARTVQRLLPTLAADAIAAAIQRERDIEYGNLAEVFAAPGAHELLGILDQLRLPWAVVTNADVRLARARLGRAEINPPFLVTVEDVTDGKPDPEGYLLAASQFQVPPSACLVVEDSGPGLAAGRAAGMRTVALKGLDGDLRLADLEQLSHLMRRDR